MNDRTNPQHNRPAGSTSARDEQRGGYRMEPRRIMRRRGAAGFSHMALLAGICALAISASPALAYWQDAGGALGASDGPPRTSGPVMRF